MKPTTVYISVAILCVLMVLLWPHRTGLDDGMPAKRLSAKDTFREGRIPADGEVGARRARHRENDKSTTSDRNLIARAKEAAIQGILDGNADLPTTGHLDDPQRPISFVSWRDALTAHP